MNLCRSVLKQVLCTNIHPCLLYTDRELSYGLVIVSGKARSGNGEKMVEGVFVQKVLLDSPADNDGRSVLIL